MSVNVAVRERPILFSGAMVRAILDGRKTQTRRVVTPLPEHRLVHGLAGLTIGMDPADDGAVWYDADGVHPGREVRCPYGAPLDRLYIREAWAPVSPDEFRRPIEECQIEYRADTPDARRAGGWDDAPDDAEAIRWRPSIHMPRWASRLTLEITDVRVERVQDITEADAIAEGATRRDAGWSMDWSRVGQPSRFAGGIHPRGHEQPLTERDIALGSARMAFANAWNDLNSRRGFGWDTNPWAWVLSFRRLP